MRLRTRSKTIVGALFFVLGLLVFGGFELVHLAQRSVLEDDTSLNGSSNTEFLANGEEAGAAPGSVTVVSTTRDQPGIESAIPLEPRAGDPIRPMASTLLVTGRILDAFGGPLLSAKIQVASDPASYAVGREGRFRVRCELADALRVSAPGYVSVQIEVPDAARGLELGEVRMRGSASATILVHSADGRVLPDIRVRIASSLHSLANAQARDRAWRDCGLTDGEGKLLLAGVPDRSPIDFVMTRGDASAFEKEGFLIENGCMITLIEPSMCPVSVANRGLPAGEWVEVQVRSLERSRFGGGIVSAVVTSTKTFELEPGAYELVATRGSGWMQSQSFSLDSSGSMVEFQWDNCVEVVVNVRFDGSILGSDFVAYSETCDTQERAEKRRRRTLESGRPQGTVIQGSGDRVVSFYHSSALPAGAETWVVIAVLAPGAQVWVESFACTAGARREVEVRLIADDAACEIRGKARALEAGSKILNYRRPTPASLTWELQGEASLSRDHSFVFSGLRAGMHELRVLGPWMEIPLATLVLAPGEKLEGEFEFLPGAILLQCALDSAVEEGALQHPVIVACDDAKPTGLLITGVPSDGGIQFAPLAAGSYVITLADEAREIGSHPAPEQVISVAPGERVFVEWHMPLPIERFRVPIHLGWIVDWSAIRVAVVPAERPRKWSGLEWLPLDSRHTFDLAARRGESLVCVVGLKSSSTYHLGSIAPLHVERRVADDSLTALGITVPAPSDWNLSFAGEHADRGRYLQATHDDLGTLFGHFYPLGTGGNFNLMAPGSYKVKGMGRGTDGVACERELNLHLASGRAQTTAFEWN